MSPSTPRPVADPEMEAYADAHSTRPSLALEAIDRSTREWSDYPAMMIDASEARLLAMLVSISRARRILEVGTFSGFSAVAMAEALPPDGHITTLEVDARHAAKSREHIEGAGFGDRVTIVEGPAIASLEALDGPFDLAFIDADKPGYPAYFEAIVPRMRPGGLIIADNVLRQGRVLDGSSEEVGIIGMRDFNDRVAEDPRVESVMLTIRDGVTLMRVRD